MNHRSKRDDPFTIFYLTFSKVKDNKIQKYPYGRYISPNIGGELNFRVFGAFYWRVKIEIIEFAL